MTGLFPDLGYLIFLLMIACVILPIFSLLLINLTLYESKVSIVSRIFYNSMFLLLFLTIQKIINESHTKYLIYILEIENILTVILLLILLLKLKKLHL